MALDGKAVDCVPFLCCILRKPDAGWMTLDEIAKKAEVLFGYSSNSCWKKFFLDNLEQIRKDGVPTYEEMDISNVLLYRCKDADLTRTWIENNEETLSKHLLMKENYKLIVAGLDPIIMGDNDSKENIVPIGGESAQEEHPIESQERPTPTLEKQEPADDENSSSIAVSGAVTSDVNREYRPPNLIHAHMFGFIYTLSKSTGSMTVEEVFNKMKEIFPYYGRLSISDQEKAKSRLVYGLDYAAVRGGSGKKFVEKTEGEQSAYRIKKEAFLQAFEARLKTIGKTQWESWTEMPGHFNELLKVVFDREVDFPDMGKRAVPRKSLSLNRTRGESSEDEDAADAATPIRTSKGTKAEPSIPLDVVIAMIILSSRQHRMYEKDIADAVKRLFPYFEQRPQDLKSRLSYIFRLDSRFKKTIFLHHLGTRKRLTKYFLGNEDEMRDICRRFARENKELLQSECGLRDRKEFEQLARFQWKPFESDFDGVLGREADTYDAQLASSSPMPQAENASSRRHPLGLSNSTARTTAESAVPQQSRRKEVVKNNQPVEQQRNSVGRRRESDFVDQPKTPQAHLQRADNRDLPERLEDAGDRRNKRSSRRGRSSGRGRRNGSGSYSDEDEDEEYYRRSRKNGSRRRSRKDRSRSVSRARDNRKRRHHSRSRTRSPHSTHRRSYYSYDDMCDDSYYPPFYPPPFHYAPTPFWHGSQYPPHGPYAYGVPPPFSAHNSYAYYPQTHPNPHHPTANGGRYRMTVERVKIEVVDLTGPPSPRQETYGADIEEMDDDMHLASDQEVEEQSPSTLLSIEAPQESLNDGQEVLPSLATAPGQPTSEAKTSLNKE